MTAKNKLIRNIIISITAIVLLLACYLFVLQLDTEKKQTDEDKNGFTFVVSENIKDVSSVHIKNPNTEYDIVLRDNPEGEVLYTISSVDKGRLESDLVEAAVFSLLKLPAMNTLNQRGQDFSMFGIEDDEDCYYTVQKKNGSNIKVIFGDKTPDGKGVYCTIQGKNEVYVISTQNASTVMAKPDDYFVTSILNINNATEIEKFSLTKSGEKIMTVDALADLDSKSENALGGVWKLTYPWQEDIDTEKFASMMNRLIEIEATGFGEKETKPVFDYEISLSADSGEYKLSIGGETPEGGAYLSDGENLYVVDASVRTLIEKLNPDDYLLKFVNLVYMDDVSDVTIYYKDKEYKLEPEKDNKQYLFCETEIPEKDFKKLYQTVVGTLYTEHTDVEPTGETHLKILYNYKDGASEAVEYYEYDERTFIAARPNKSKVIVLQSELKTITDLINKGYK